jgi:integrase
MAKSARVNLTVQRIAEANCPAEKSELILQDAVVPGLAVRVYPTGRKVFIIQYRTDGGGRSAPQRRLALGEVAAISLSDARKAAKKKLGEVAGGGDPSGERKVARRKERERLEPTLDAYEASLERRRVVKRDEVMSLLRRELLRPLGNVELGTITRNDLVKRIAAVEASGRPGAAQELRKVAAVFLGWAAETGLISVSPLAGWRRKRRTRAERLDRPGRALADRELPILWQAASATGWPFGPYLQMLLLLGQRRTETALMRWSDLNVEKGVWTVPAEITKSGREHRVPLPAQAVAILKLLPRMARSDFVFPGHRGAPLTGWSKRLPPVYGATAKAGMAPWSLHDLRRTMRTGLGRLGADRIVAELLLNHAISDELTAIYDRAEYWQQRVEAAGRWAEHVMALIEGGGGAVVPLRARASR